MRRPPSAGTDPSALPRHVNDDRSFSFGSERAYTRTANGMPTSQPRPRVSPSRSPCSRPTSSTRSYRGALLQTSGTFPVGCLAQPADLPDQLTYSSWPRSVAIPRRRRLTQTSGTNWTTSAWVKTTGALSSDRPLSDPTRRFDVAKGWTHWSPTPQRSQLSVRTSPSQPIGPSASIVPLFERMDHQTPAETGNSAQRLARRPSSHREDCSPISASIRPSRWRPHHGVADHNDHSCLRRRLPTRLTERRRSGAFRPLTRE